MSFQYTYDASGKPVGVFVPINEWEELTNELKRVQSGKQSGRSAILKMVAKGLREVQQIKQGKLKPVSMKQLLDEL